MQSISASGYIDIEPLIVVGRADKLVVIEGNRRLAALKLLQDPDLAAECKLSVPVLSPEVQDSLKQASVYRVENEHEARDLIGFKHINGPQAWDAYAKALYARKWLDEERSKRGSTGHGLTLRDIAHRMGDKHDTISRIVTAAYVIEQAEEERCFAIEDRARRNFSFSHLYTALTYPEFRDYVGLRSPQRGDDPPKRPVPHEFLRELRQLLLWLYGSKSEGVEPAVKRQNPDLGRLKRVLADPRSRRVMLERQNLDEAIESTISTKDRFEKNLIDAEQSLSTAQSALDAYDGADATLLEIGKSVNDKARLIFRHMVMIRADATSTDDN